MGAVKITDRSWWVGVQNPSLRVFDVIMRTEWGTSYNSYLLKGDDKTALVDCVKDGFLGEQLNNIKEICDPTTIDYIIVNHTEPDHSGALEEMLKVVPNAKIVCTRAAKTLIGELLNHEFDCIVVGDNDSINLGNMEIKFVAAPFLHWPDTMFTYVQEEKLLLTCDAFGFHFSAPEIFDDKTMLSKEMVESQKYYFDVIMSPFKQYVLQAIEKIADLQVSVIGPSHGPVLRGDPKGAIDRYSEWAKIEEPCPNIYIGYVSCYGYTKKLAEQVALGIHDEGLNADIEDIAEIPSEVVSTKIMNACAFALGSPTLNRDVLPPVWGAMTHLSAYGTKGKKAAVFGTFGWSGEACKYMEQRLTNLGVDVVGSARAKVNPSEKELQEARELGKKLAQSIK